MTKIWQFILKIYVHSCKARIIYKITLIYSVFYFNIRIKIGTKTFSNFLDQRPDADVSPQTLASEEIVAFIITAVLLCMCFTLSDGSCLLLRFIEMLSAFLATLFIIDKNLTSNSTNLKIILRSILI